MHPILGRLGPLLLTSYQVIWGFGLVTGIWLGARLSLPQEPLKKWLDPLLAGAFAGILAGRLVYVWLNWDYFQFNLHGAWQVQRGGLNYQAMLLVGLVGAWTWARWRRLRWSHVAGLLALLLPWWHATGWAACLLDGCAYGRLAGNGLLVAALPDSHGVVELRYASQALGLGMSLLAGLAVIWARRTGLAPSRQLWLALALLTSAGAAVAWFRGDKTPIIATTVADLRLDFLVNAGIALVTLALAGRRPKPESVLRAGV